MNHQLGAPPSTRFGYVSAVWSDFFILFGGYDGSNWLNDMHEFDFTRQKWSRIEPKTEPPSARSCPSWAAYKNSIFLFGGYDGVQRMNDFYEFNFQSKRWSPVIYAGPGPSSRYFHSSVVYGDNLYLFGGFNGTERLKDLYQFSFDKKTWTLLDSENSPPGRSSLVAQVYNHSLYIFGGYNGSQVLNDFYEFKLELIAIPPSSLLRDLRGMINNPLLSDVTLVVDGREILANKAILAARCEHFRALFYGGMREQQESKVFISDMNYSILEIVLGYIYTD